jgi:hypothetical protein
LHARGRRGCTPAGGATGWAALGGGGRIPAAASRATPGGGAEHLLSAGRRPRCGVRPGSGGGASGPRACYFACGGRRSAVGPVLKGCRWVPRPCAGDLGSGDCRAAPVWPHGVWFLGPASRPRGRSAGPVSRRLAYRAACLICSWVSFRWLDCVRVLRTASVRHFQGRSPIFRMVVTRFARLSSRWWRFASSGPFLRKRRQSLPCIVLVCLRRWTVTTAEPPTCHRALPRRNRH